MFVSPFDTELATVFANAPPVHCTGTTLRGQMLDPLQLLISLTWNVILSEPLEDKPPHMMNVRTHRRSTSLTMVVYAKL